MVFIRKHRDPWTSTGRLAEPPRRRRLWVDDQETVTDLQDSSLLDIDPDALREAEKVFAQGILDTMSGKEVAKATYEDTRVVVIMADGSEYYFYGFMGESRA
jgi:hypothetical protein